MNLSEKYNLELKREVTVTFLKTVSAYANYNDGEIVFGIDDNGKAIGMSDIKHECLRIESMINDCIDPVPDFRIEPRAFDGVDTIVLTVRRGENTPYYYKGKTYRRSDTSTLEVDRFELKRLVLEGSNLDYEELKANSQSLTFMILESKLREKAGIKKINIDILKTLNLYNVEGYYNTAGELLADEVSIKFSGIDIVRFGKDIDQILYRETIDRKSLLIQFDRAIELFEQYYRYEEIKAYKRVVKEIIPKKAFREALANAIIHRVWDVNSFIRISMYDDKIEIESPGGLPEGISKDEYLYSNISILRNPIIAGIFYRLDIIEKFGTGIARINSTYSNSLSKPNYLINNNSITIVLPVTREDNSSLSTDEMAAYDLLKKEVELSRKELDEELRQDKSKTIRILNTLIEKGIIEKLGQGPGITYRIK
ncbi:MAG: ATP-binding protein [Anaerovoracaceae bacterium]